MIASKDFRHKRRPEEESRRDKNEIKTKIKKKAMERKQRKFDGNKY